MRRILLSTILGLAAITGCSKKDDKAAAVNTDDLPMVSVDEVEKGLADNSLSIVDCNGDGTRKKFGIVPGAILVADEEAFPASDLPADKARKLVFYCSSPS
jgi:hypothetical protein